MTVNTILYLLSQRVVVIFTFQAACVDTAEKSWRVAFEMSRPSNEIYSLCVRNYRRTGGEAIFWAAFCKQPDCGTTATASDWRVCISELNILIRMHAIKIRSNEIIWWLCGTARIREQWIKFQKNPVHTNHDLIIQRHCEGCLGKYGIFHL